MKTIYLLTLEKCWRCNNADINIWCRTSWSALLRWLNLVGWKMIRALKLPDQNKTYFAINALSLLPIQEDSWVSDISSPKAWKEQFTNLPRELHSSCKNIWMFVGLHPYDITTPLWSHARTRETQEEKGKEISSPSFSLSAKSYCQPVTWFYVNTTLLPSKKNTVTERKMNLQTPHQTSWFVITNFIQDFIQNPR